MVARACQWLGVAIETAFSSRSSNILRMSVKTLGLTPVCFSTMATARSCAAWSMSQTAATWAVGIAM